MLRACGNHVVVEKIIAKTQGGIHLPDNAKRPNLGVIVAIGPGDKESGEIGSPYQFHVGDRVFYAHWDAHDIELDGKQYVVCTANGILAHVIDAPAIEPKKGR